MNEQLEILDKALANLRGNYADNSWHLFMWGGLILSACAFHYAFMAVLQRPELISWAWGVAVIFGVSTEVIVGVRSAQGSRGVSYLEKSIATVWALLGIAMSLLAFVAPAAGLIDYQAIIPLVMLLVWVGALFTGISIRFAPLTVLGNTWLVAVVIALAVPAANQLLLMSMSIVVGYLLPGFLLLKASR